MGNWVLRVSTLAVVVAAGGLGLGGPQKAEASSPLTALASVAVSAPVAQAGWRRQWRRQGDPVVADPNAGAAAGADVEIDGDPGAPAAVIVLPPPRPRSCGQYRYWNGDRCVDARYNDPYLGPR